MKSLIVGSLCVLFVAGTTLAEDIQSPPWRGEWSTTSQVWEFFNDDPNPIPPDGPAPNGQPPLGSTKLWVYPGDQMGWEAGNEPHYGYWELSGSMDVLVDNHEPPNEFKWVWVQITWRPQIDGAEPQFTYFEPAPTAGYEPKLVERHDFGDGWFEDTWDWRIYPNPVDETFTFGGDIDVDELVVDTWCTPEPGTLVLLGLGGLLLRRRKR